MAETIYSKMMTGCFAQLQKLVDESKKYLLQPPTFQRCIGEFSYGCSQLLQMFANPALKIQDTEGGNHFIVAGEKWKLFVAWKLIDKGAAEATIVSTNPVALAIEEFTVNDAGLSACFAGYESLYNEGIINVMKINDAMTDLGKMQSCGDQQKAMAAILDQLHAMGNTLNAYYVE